MRMLLVIWLFLLAGAAVAILLQEDTGYVMLAAGPYTVEMSLALLILLVAAGFTALYVMIRLGVRTAGLPGQVRDWQRRRGVRKAQRSTTRGLLELSEGNWKAAEKHLTRHAANAEMPLLNYLSAARAAQLQGDHDRRDNYIRLAHESMPSADVAVSLTQAELQLAHNQLEQALATLRHLRKIAPHHNYVLRLLKRLYVELEDWEHLRELMPELKKRKVADADTLHALEIRLHQALLEQAAATTDDRDLMVAWATVPRALRHDPELLASYVEHLIARGQHDEAEALLRDAVREPITDRLAALLGQVESPRPGKLLSLAENLLEQQPRNPVLLLALGRLALRAQLWGKARGYLEASIGAGGPPEAFRELGHLLEQQGEELAALEVYRHGLSGTGGPAPVTLPEHIGPAVNAPQLEQPAGNPPRHGERPVEAEMPEEAER
jgi:HemY protein